MRQIVCCALAALTASSLLLAATSVRAQSQDARTFAATGFDAIETDASDDVEVSFGRGMSVVARGDPLAVASLAVEVRGGTLRVGRTPGTHMDRGATLFVTMPALRAATSEGSGSIRAPSVTGRRFAGTISGSGRLELPNLHVEEAEFVINGSGSIAADGSAERVRLAMGGSGRIDAGRLKAADVGIDSAGSGPIIAAASRTARIRVAGSGDVRVIGHPSCQLSGTGVARIICG